MINRKIDSYIKEYYQTTHKALLITGARQIGKTFSIRKFGKSYKSFVEINFVDFPEAVTIFKGAKSSEDILLRLSALTSAPLIKGKTLIFFDEVQLCPEIVTAIKFLVDEGSYRYILSGSLLGVFLKDLRSEPVGYMGVKEMYPLDFEEFVSALGLSERVLTSLQMAWQECSPIDEVLHAKMMDLFRLYLIVGGMPASVAKYLESNNIQEVMVIQRDIISLYKRDITQYDQGQKLHISEIFDLIPPELNAKNKRFILKSLRETARFSSYENSFLWLTHAGVALPAYNVEEPKVPLLLSRSRNLFKLFQSDVGLLAAQYAEGIQLRVLKGDKDINYGSIYENAVAQELVAHDFKLYYYNNKKRGEIDFVVERGGKILPIEVKSGKDYESHRALSNVLDVKEYGIEQAIVLGSDNLKRSGRVLYVPIYMIMFLQKESLSLITYTVDLTSLQQ